MNDVAGIIAILSAVALPIATGLVIGLTSVKNQHRERMGLINQGIIPPDTPERKASPNRMVSLRNGIVLMSIGVGLVDATEGRGVTGERRPRSDRFSQNVRPGGNADCDHINRNRMPWGRNLHSRIEHIRCRYLYPGGNHRVHCSGL